MFINETPFYFSEARLSQSIKHLPSVVVGFSTEQ